jgi:hypothetical protein
MNPMVEVQFHGDRIQATRAGERVWVVVKRVCEALGIDHDSQRKRLLRTPWAVTAMMTATGPDGKNYEVACLDLDALPMWLATIEVSRVRPEAREKLIAYQRECARVLRDHFFGAPRQDAPDFAAFARELVGEILRQVDQRIDSRIGAMSFGVVRPWELGAVKRRLSAAADLAVLAKAFPSRKSALAGLTMRIRTACGWTGTGAHMNRMPASMLPYAERELAAIEREFQRSGNVRQLRLGEQT